MTIRKQGLGILIAVWCGLWTVTLHATERGAGKVERIPTRDGVSIPIYTYWRAEAVATIVLFSGGGGGYGKIGGDGWPESRNFLIRTGRNWAAYPFNIVMIGRPSDGLDLSSGAIRAGGEHANDNRAILRHIKARSRLPLWVIGTSMGSLSAAAVAIEDGDRLISGVVLTSSVTAYKVPGALPRQDLERIRIPVLILHHRDDACWACPPHEAKQIASRLTQAPYSKTLMVDGGSGAHGNPCEPMHHHGFVGMEGEAVKLIAQWILDPRP